MLKQKFPKSVGYGCKNKKFIGLASASIGVTAAVFCVFEAFATATIERFNYVAGVLNAFDIKAEIGEAAINTAKGDDGYNLSFVVGDDEVAVENLADGESVENNGVRLTLAGVSTSDGKGLTVTYNVENTSDEAKTFKLGTWADTEFAGNDENDIYRIGTSSIRMYQQDNTLENYGAEMTLSFVPNAATTWIGNKDDVVTNLYTDAIVDNYSGNSALAYSWVGTLEPSATERYSVVATPGANNLAADINFFRRGASSAFESFSKNLGEDFTTAAVNEYEGFGVCSWNTEQDGSGDTYAAETTSQLMDYTDINLYEHCPAIVYNIDYDLDEGEAENPETYTIESDNIAIARPTRTGYRFLGWTGTDLASYTLDVTIPAGSMNDRSYAAHWEHVNYTINFEENGGSTVSNIIKFYDEAIVAPNDPERLGYDFAGWYDNAELEGEPYVFATMPADNITLFADWTPVVYNITYDLDGGELAVANPETYTIESETFGLNNPTRTGYTFAGWIGTELDEASTSVSITTGSHDDRTYTATWTINQYTISFETNGGSIISSITGDYNSAVSDPEAGPEKTGYTFVGWFADPELTIPYVFTTIPAEDITVYAKWEVTNYNLTVNADAHATVLVKINTAEAATLEGEGSISVVTDYFKTNIIKITPAYGYYVSALSVNETDSLDDLVEQAGYSELTLTDILEDTVVAIETTEYARADYSELEATLATIPEDLSIYATNPVEALTDLVEDIAADREAYNNRYIFDQDVVDNQNDELEAAIAALKLIGTVTEEEDDADNNYGAAILTDTPEALVEKIGLTDGEEAQRVGDGVNVKLSLSVETIEADEEDVDQALINEYIAAHPDELPLAKVVEFLDITLTKQLEGQAPILVTETAEPLGISLGLPEEALEVAENVTRHFYMLRLHDGEVTLIEGERKADRYEFESDEFSTFALIYFDTVAVPNTGRNTASTSAVAIAVPSAVFASVLAGLGFYFYNRRARREF